MSILEIILYYLLVALVAISWMFFIVPLLFRLFGVPLSLNPRKRWSVKLSLWQSIFVKGVLGWGVGMIIVVTADHYLQWRLHGRPEDQLTIGRFVHIVCTWLLGGVFFGGMMHLGRGNSPEAKQPPS
ncbi:MAG: hypothetical protein WCA89_12400 [Terracidiphilus sp.]|jgi:hypothetical protein